MEQNKILLSQSEIDTLLAFLQNKKENVTADVLDQENIDKLIFLLQSSEKQKLRFDSVIPAINLPGSYPFIILDSSEDMNSQKKNCILTCIKTDDHLISILCTNQKSGTVYNITPSCLEKRQYFSDTESMWGTAVPPIVFDQIATLLQVQYTKETYQFVCQCFAEIIFRDSHAVIPSYYIPLEASLLKNLRP